MMAKEVVLAVRHLDERQAVTSLLEDMGMDVHHAETGWDAIYILEDHPCDFLLMDSILPDMHAWQLLGTLKESINVAELPIVIITDEPAVLPLSNVTTVVRPVSMAKLRNIIFSLFSHNA